MLKTTCPKPYTKKLSKADYAKFRVEVFKADGWQCRFCRRDVTPGHSSKLEVHHIQRRGQGRIDELWNCVAVCHPLRSDCHELLTRNKARIEFTDAEKREVRVYLEPEIKLMKELEEARLEILALKKENADLRNRLGSNGDSDFCDVVEHLVSLRKIKNADAVRRIRDALLPR